MAQKSFISNMKQAYMHSDYKEWMNIRKENLVVVDLRIVTAQELWPWPWRGENVILAHKLALH